jgi:uncharacterized glyoxalase superfamily protein PhnB
MSKPSSGKSVVIPGLRYRDSAKAVEWLCQAFGFEKKLVVPGPNGSVVHAELTHESGMVMLGSGEAHGNVNYGKYVRTPSDLGGKVSGGMYVIVDDPDAHYARAKQAGAEIVLDIKTEEYGGRGYTCRDFEGHVWTFGSYDPWAG